MNSERKKGMICLTFEREANDRIICHDRNELIRLELNEGTKFENRECICSEEAFQFDGYSTWFEGGMDSEKAADNFTLSFCLAPQEYSDQGDGIFSCFNEAERKGLYIKLMKHGKIEVGFGNGREIFFFSSINKHTEKNTWNMISVIFRKDAGWCDLYINGILSNRRQFPRHMRLDWPEGKLCLGKYMADSTYEEKKTGVFCGWMKGILVHDYCLSFAEAERLHAQYPCGQKVAALSINRAAWKNDIQRPAYHLIAPGKWMNEPDAPVYYKGNYHIFYQANVHAPIWNHIQWGHMISTDMVHWRDLPLALETEEGTLDPDGCWSGSALIDKNGLPRIYYTAGNNEKFPNQSVAMAVSDAEDIELTRWHKQDSPVQEQTEGWMGEFRDPFVWLEKDTYFMLVGTGDENNGGGNAILYSSGDGLDWTSHGFLLDYEYEKNEELGHVWELPVLLPLRDANGNIYCHILLLCACQIENAAVETYYFLGYWNSEEKSFHKFHEKAMLLDLGNGTFTGPSGFVTPDKRSVLFTIAQGKRKGEEEFYSGWAHNGGLPLELSIAEGKLRLKPIREIYALKKKKLLELADVSSGEANRQLALIKGNRLWMLLCTDCDEAGIVTCCEEQRIKVYYDRKTGRLGAEDEKQICMGKYRGTEDLVALDGGEIRMEYFLDHSMIEVYLNEQKSMSLRNYIRGTERTVRVSEGMERITKLEVWEMENAY